MNLGFFILFALFPTFSVSISIDITRTEFALFDISPQEDLEFHIRYPQTLLIFPMHETFTIDVFRPAENESFQLVSSINSQYSSFGAFFPNGGFVNVHTRRNTQAAFYSVISDRKCVRYLVSTYQNENFYASKSKSDLNNITIENNQDVCFLHISNSRPVTATVNYSIEDEYDFLYFQVHQKEFLKESDKIQQKRASKTEKSQVDKTNDQKKGQIPKSDKIKNKHQKSQILELRNLISSRSKNRDKKKKNEFPVEKVFTGDGYSEFLSTNISMIVWHSDPSTLSSYFDIQLTSNSTLPEFRTNFTAATSVPTILIDKFAKPYYERAEIDLINSQDSHKTVNFVYAVAFAVSTVVVIIAGVIILCRKTPATKTDKQPLNEGSDSGVAMRNSESIDALTDTNEIHINVSDIENGNEEEDEMINLNQI
ncbi:hypothetical protein TRFO_37324 [Tritrichomonas foetus]|uniref:CUB-like domain-containing protein n=1 Tax=Tritrichomonas foetus TaxID=1144522 RepID=A0A1J4JDV6_9EUKA|nr:hypothetical protein TRFO_37324 [Tritrichomonas foetus]|eukprot:OHS96471.1 hypothetical protein TRFO_37324 [Tritrichomonas foetus]